MLWRSTSCTTTSPAFTRRRASHRRRKLASLLPILLVGPKRFMNFEHGIERIGYIIRPRVMAARNVFLGMLERRFRERLPFSLVCFVEFVEFLVRQIFDFRFC